MKLYRICTENKNREQVKQAVASFFDGFTVFETVGYWRGEREQSLVIEIVGTAYDCMLVSLIAINIRNFNQQQSVLVQELEIGVRFV